MKLGQKTITIKLELNDSRRLAARSLASVADAGSQRTTETAKILNISSARLRVLLIAGRVEGAYKTGKMWLIPLFNGKPIISKGKRGPEARWRNPRKPAKTIVHVNTHRIKHNQKNSKKQPVITVKNSNTNNRYCYEVEILGGCRVVYSPDKPICGARVWIESLYEVKLIT